MKPTTVTPHPSGVTITCHASNAEGVFLAGTFNDWSPTATPMDAVGDEQWTTDIDLTPGRYEFKFVVDGEWCCNPGSADDNACEDGVPNEHGTVNRVFDVPVAQDKPAN